MVGLGAIGQLAGETELSWSQLYSLLLSHFEAWTDFAADPALPDDAWAAFFEDDARVHDRVRHDQTKLQAMLADALVRAQQEGFLYLGICNPSACGEWEEVGGLGKGCGWCLHAYAVTRWKARVLGADIARVQWEAGHELARPPEVAMTPLTIQCVVCL